MPPLPPISRQRCFLFLQGPTGPFFRRFARQLIREGHRVITASVSLGDAVFNCSGEIVTFHDGIEHWGAFLTDLHGTCDFTDIVVYNDCRPYHRVALDVLRPLGVRVHIFEEGYFRPNRITYEANGVNGFSPFCGDGFPGEEYVMPDASHAPDHIKLPPSLRHIYVNTFMYYLLAGALNPIFYPKYKFHRTCHPGRELFARMRRFCLYPLDMRKSARRQQALLSGQRRYFMLLLQLSGDTQIKVHSPFAAGGMRELISFVIADFAVNAPRDVMLVVKNHPLDNGMEKLKLHVRAAAKGHGLEDRILFIDKGHLPELVKHTEGVLVTNSTAGTSALHHGIPIMCFGEAIYVREGLAQRHGENGATLARFWRRPVPPSHEAYLRFRDVMHARTQIYGNYYTKEGVACLLKVLMAYKPFSSKPDAIDITDPSVCLCAPTDPEK